MLDYIANLVELALQPGIVFSLLMVGAVYWSIVFSVFITMRLHSQNNGRNFKSDMEIMAGDPQAMARYYAARLVAYALIASACVFAAP
jgi:hypothetical protein